MREECWNGPLLYMWGNGLGRARGLPQESNLSEEITHRLYYTTKQHNIIHLLGPAVIRQ